MTGDTAPERPRTPWLLTSGEVAEALPSYGPVQQLPSGEPGPPTIYSAATVRRWVREGRLRPHRDDEDDELGVHPQRRRLLFERRDVEAMLRTWRPWSRGGPGPAEFVDEFRRNIGYTAQ